MNNKIRSVTGFLLLLLVLVAVGWSMKSGKLPRADFTFVNGAEVKSVDPALVTGQPEGRIIMCLFEGLVGWDPKTLDPIPAAAERWEISKDGLQYTFHIRKDASWSNGKPIDANDFYYNFRRLLDPTTGSEYSIQLWYIKNSEKYNTGTRDLKAGDLVEIELNEQPKDALPHARGKILRGRLEKIERMPENSEPEGEGKKEINAPIFHVRIDGKLRQFQAEKKPEKDGVESCKLILFDFSQVGVKVLDNHTLQITLQKKTPYFINLMGFYPFFPVNQECLETYGSPGWTDIENIVTNGPFVLKFHRIRDRIRLAKSPAYWDRENVRLNTIDALAVGSDTTGLNLYLTDVVDWIPTVPASVVQQLQEQNRDDFDPTAQMVVNFYRFNTRKPPLDNPTVRKALALAVNKQDIVDTITQAGEIPADSFVPPGIQGYSGAASESYNPQLAAKLLAEAGYPKGKGFPKIDILYNTNASQEAMAQLIQAQWQENLGIQVGARNEEWGSYLSSARLGNYLVVRSGWIGDYVDPNTFLDMFLSDSPMNQTGWKNKQYDQLVEQAQVETDRAKRMELFRKAEQILMKEQPIMPLYFGVSKNMIRPYVKGFYSNIQDVHPLKFVSIDETEKQEFLKRTR